MGKSKEYDEIAEHIFGPIYREIAGAIVRRTGVREGRFLDVGCGGGHLGFAVLREGYFHGILMDIRDEAVEIARQRAKNQHVGDRIEVICGDVQNMPFPDDSFDLVVSRGSMYFWPDQEKAFREILRVTRQGAWAYIGGGMGNRELRERAHKMMQERQMKRRDKSDSMELTDQEYETMFRDTNVDFQIIRNPEEGHWLIFHKH